MANLKEKDSSNVARAAVLVGLSVRTPDMDILMLALLTYLLLMKAGLVKVIEVFQAPALLHLEMM